MFSHEHRDVAQLGRASRLGRESRRFESCRPDHVKALAGAWYSIGGAALAVPLERPWSNRIRHESSKLEDGGSSPSGRMIYCPFVVTVAQLVRAPVCGTGGRGSDPRQSPQHVAEDTIVESS